MATKKYLDQHGLTTLVDKIKTLISDIGHFIFKGSVDYVVNLPLLSDVTEGWVYEIKNTDVTTSDFVEGAGEVIAATSEVICTVIDVSGTPTKKWALLGPIFDVRNKLTFGTSMPSNPSNGDTFLYTGNTTYVEYSETLTKDSNPNLLGLFEKDNQDNYSITSDTEPTTVYKAWSDGSNTYFTKSATPSANDTVYIISGGEVSDSGYTVVSYDATDGIVISSGEESYARTSASDSYIAEKTYYVEQYMQGVVYQYNSSTSSWDALSSGDEFTPIPDSDINALFS